MTHFQKSGLTDTTDEQYGGILYFLNVVFNMFEDVVASYFNCI